VRFYFNALQSCKLQEPEAGSDVFDAIGRLLFYTSDCFTFKIEGAMQLTKFPYEGAKIDIQTAGIKMNNYMKKKVDSTIKNLMNVFPEINSMDIYFKESEENVVGPRTVTVRVGILGPDVVASDSEFRWKAALKNVEKKLIRQLEKKRAVLVRMKEL